MRARSQVGKVLILAGAVLWVVWALQADFRWRPGMSSEGQGLLVAAAGCIIAWGIWQRLYG